MVTKIKAMLRELDEKIPTIILKVRQEIIAGGKKIMTD
jgi:hypothetical protein